MERQFFIWAHRGASNVAPENTLAAFGAALEAGADGIELDVHLSRDGVPVVLHDDTLERTTNGRGAVLAVPARDLLRLDAGGWFSPRFRGEGIPTLAQVLLWAGERLRLNIEIKSAAAGAAVLDLLGDFPGLHPLVSSFDHGLLERLRHRSGDLALGFLTESRFWRRALRRARLCRAESLHPRQDLVSRPLLEACRRAGLAVYPWTVDAPGRLETLWRAGVDGVFTNDPAGVRQWFKRRRKAPQGRGEEGR